MSASSVVFMILLVLFLFALLVGGILCAILIPIHVRKKKRQNSAPEE